MATASRSHAESEACRAVASSRTCRSKHASVTTAASVAKAGSSQSQDTPRTLVAPHAREMNARLLLSGRYLSSMESAAASDASSSSR
jgi:hypothetical protein